MKITFVCGDWTHFSGGNRVIALYAQKLQQRGHDVFVVCPSRPKPSIKKQVRSLVTGNGWLNLSPHDVTYFDHTDIPRIILDHRAPVTDADVPDADVVIATWWETAEWVANLSPSKGAKAYFIQHFEAFDYLPKQRVEATWSLPLYKITICNWLVDLARTRYGDSDVSLVPNSVDTEQFYAPPRGKQSRPTVGLIYNSVPWKGCEVGFQAFSLAAQKFPELRLIVFSVESSPQLPLPSETEFIAKPAQNQIKDIYARCDAWLFPSRLEGFGLPILEAMACRTPVIGMPAGAAPELLADGCGILVQPEDPVDMAKGIETVVKMSETQWQQMSDAAYAKATRYTWDNATDRFEGALYKAIERSNSGWKLAPSPSQTVQKSKIKNQ